MVKSLKIILKCFIMTGGLVWLIAGYCGDVLIDPTKPPAAAIQANSTGGGSVAMPDQGPVLQAVKISGKRKLATISGQEYRLGDKVGDAKLVAVRDHEADLRNPDGSLQTLQMYSGVTKTVIGPKKKTPSRTEGKTYP